MNTWRDVVEKMKKPVGHVYLVHVAILPRAINPRVHDTMNSVIMQTHVNKRKTFNNAPTDIKESIYRYKDRVKEQIKMSSN
jgi:hypothetical protein